MILDKKYNIINNKKPYNGKYIIDYTPCIKDCRKCTIDITKLSVGDWVTYEISNDRGFYFGQILDTSEVGQSNSHYLVRCKSDNLNVEWHCCSCYKILYSSDKEMGLPDPNRLLKLKRILNK